MRKKTSNGSINIGDVLYLLVNPEVIRRGYIRLKVKKSKDGRLIACRNKDPIRYDVSAWKDQFILTESECRRLIKERWQE